MSEPGAASAYSNLRQRITAIVQQGDAIRRDVRGQVAEVLQDTELDARGCRQLAEAVVDGARAGLHDTDEGEREGRFQAALDGLVDGLAAAAEAVKLTVEEARASGRQFAAEDLARAKANLKALSGLFQDALRETADKAGKEWGTQGTRIGQHFQQAWQRVEDPLRAALLALKEEPLASGREAVQAGLRVATHTTGALFAEVGRRLQRLGERLGGDKSRSG